MSVYQRKEGGNWVVDYWPEGRNGPHVRKTLDPSVKTREDAVRWEAVMRKKPGTDDATPSSLTVRQLFPRYLKEWAELQLGALTAEDIERAFGNHILRLLGEFAVCDMNKQKVNLYKAARKNDRTKTGERVKNRTINKELSYLSGFLTWCREEAKLDVPEFGITMLPSKRPKPIVLTLEETVKFLAAAEPFYRALFACLYFLGLRRQEARMLKWERLDFKGGMVLVENTKGGDPKILPLSKWAMFFLDEIKPEKPKGYVFLNPATGRPVLKIAGAIRRAKEKAGIIKRVTPHLLRHSFATHLLDLEVNLRSIQGLLGHARVATTEWYTHLSISTITQASNRLTDAVDQDLSKALGGKGVYTKSRLREGNKKDMRIQRAKKHQ